MKKTKLIASIALFVGLFSACVEKPKEDPIGDLDLTFSFQTRTAMNLDVQAINELGNPSPSTLFSVYTENPYDDNGDIIAAIKPIYQGYTESNGKVSVLIEAPNSSESIFVVPEYEGYGGMKEIKRTNANVSVELKGVPISSGTKAMFAESTNIERDRIDCGNNFHFYRYYTTPEDYESDYGVLNTNSELVSEEFISNDIKEYVNTLFQEGVKNFDSFLNSEINITENDTEIWLTFIGDGGYTSGKGYTTKCLNSLLSYTYTGDDALDFVVNSEMDLKRVMMDRKINIAYAFIDMNTAYTPCGTKVQLLYWNGEKYVSKFPAGVKVGFALLVDGYRKSPNTSSEVRDFNLETKNIKFSTKKINYSGETYGIIVKSDVYNCYFMGMEYGSSADRDFNEAIFKVVTSKEVTLENNQEVPPEREISSTYQGTLAFEDIWPYTGDYDLNDFVVDYKYELYKTRGTNYINTIKMTFTPLANGAANDNGFGIQLPLAMSNVTISGATLEQDNNLTTLIVLPEIREAFGGVSGTINTSLVTQYIEADSSVVIIKLGAPIPETNIPYLSFNPFIFPSNNRGKEIHLVDYAPTSKMDMSFFSTGADKSVPENGTYYRMNNLYPWALDIASSGINDWKYPLEMVKITDAYLHYSEWASDHDLSWFDWTIPANRDMNKLYHQ